MPLLDFILHIDAHLIELAAQYGIWIYAILFLIVFAETGLVVTPFLPGDSLLFALGAMGAIGAIDPLMVAAVVVVAAFCGDNSNYFIGRFFGHKLFSNSQSRIFRKEYLDKTHAFYAKYGAPTVVIARFVPFVRTFAPFVAGMGEMPYVKYISFSLLGSLLWTAACVGAGYFFGNIPVVKEHFSLVVIALVLLPGIPAVVTVLKHWWSGRQTGKVAR
ncbi:DedA family protein [Permianibacter sp. IMCC34836]|uniref:DedA family protein n=1 Tax=Permianibacter fluminis TaxID=2738515 RepID=UPI001557E60E|nr:DedA family protein [Permianibacter fluminis]NQD37798.1 DedA family protein [Permianibacter fluminis]